jgi:predicted dehydrogenase
MTPLRLGLIGVGKHGSRYARHIVQDMPHLRLVGLARRNREAARAQAEELGCRAYEDYRELLAAPDIDAVIVVVPPTLHVEIIEAAAAHRRPVLLEKPAAPSVEAGQHMLRAVRAAGIPVMVAQTLRYNGVVRRLMAERARLGHIHAARIAQHFEPSRPGWIDDPTIAAGGITLHTGVHSFDLARRLTGMEAERVSCEMTQVGTQHTEDNFSAVIRMRGGTTVAAVAGSRATASRSGGIELSGASGMLIADHVLNTAQYVHGTTVTPLPVPDPIPTVREVLTDFVTALQRSTPMPIPLEEGLRAVAIADACYRAARSGHAEPVVTID